MSRHELLGKLHGGDLRSKGRSDEVVREVVDRADPSRIGELVAGLGHDEAVVSMRCADALEKISREVPGILQQHRSTLLELLEQPQPKEVLWHLLQIAPRITWSSAELPGVHAAVRRALSDPSAIVRVCALQAMVELLDQAPRLRAEVARRVDAALLAEAPALRARARKLKALLQR